MFELLKSGTDIDYTIECQGYAWTVHLDILKAGGSTFLTPGSRVRAAQTLPC
jgi:hypothetical protein